MVAKYSFGGCDCGFCSIARSRSAAVSCRLTCTLRSFRAPSRSNVARRRSASNRRASRESVGDSDPTLVDERTGVS